MDPLTTLDHVTKRIRLYVSTFILAASVIGALTAFTVRQITSHVREDLQQLDHRILEISRVQHNYNFSDSIRFERAMDVLELAVAAIVESDGSPEKQGAVVELRRRRHIVPREGDR